MRKVIGVTLLLIFVGVVLSVVGFLLSDETDFKLFQKADYDLKELTYEKLEVKELSIILNNRDVIITPSESDQIEITYYESEYDWFEIETDGNQLDIINRTKWYLGVSWGLFNLTSEEYTKVEIKLPASVIDYEIDITTSNGTIDLNDLLQLKELKLKSSNGTIRVNDVHVTDYFKLDTSNGKILVDDVSSDALMIVHTSNGEINIDNIIADNIDASTSNGAIEVRIVGQYDNYRIEMDTSNGTNYIDGEERNDSIYNPTKSNKIKLDTSNGSIRLYFID